MHFRVSYSHLNYSSSIREQPPLPLFAAFDIGLNSSFLFEFGASLAFRLAPSAVSQVAPIILSSSLSLNSAHL